MKHLLFVFVLVVFCGASSVGLLTSGDSSLAYAATKKRVRKSYSTEGNAQRKVVEHSIVSPGLRGSVLVRVRSVREIGTHKLPSDERLSARLSERRGSVVFNSGSKNRDSVMQETAENLQDLADGKVWDNHLFSPKDFVLAKESSKVVINKSVAQEELGYQVNFGWADRGLGEKYEPEFNWKIYRYAVESEYEFDAKSNQRGFESESSELKSESGSSGSGSELSEFDFELVQKPESAGELESAIGQKGVNSRSSSRFVRFKQTVRRKLSRTTS